MALEVVGKIKEVLDKKSGESKSGKSWVKQEFLVKTDEQYNNLYCFEVFGEDKVNSLSNLSVGDTVQVSFNVSTNEYNGRYYTSLSAWRLSSNNSAEVQDTVTVSDDDDLPF